MLPETFSQWDSRCAVTRDSSALINSRCWSKLNLVMYPLLYFSFNVSILKVSQIILINICITYLYTTSGLFVNKSLEPETKVKTFSKILIHPQNLLRQIPLICSIQKMRKQYVACVQSMCGQQVSKIRLTHMVQLQSLLVSPCS